MERSFRGYPQALAAFLEEQREKNEDSYFKGLYPLEIKRKQGVVDRAGDRLEYRNSPMYDEFPDREFLYQVREQIAKEMEKNGMEADRDLILVLLLNEISRRRRLNRK